MTAVLRPRSKSLPIAPTAKPSKRHLQLLDDVRDIDRAQRPNYAVWEITLACDLACRHCGSRAGRARPDELSTEQCFDLVDQMATLGVREVSLIGGEAYLREDWLSIVRRIRERGMMCQITTGARGLTEDVIRAAKDAGLQSVSISVDGFESVHDALRGVRGSFAAVKSAFAALKRVGGVRITANTQINRLNLREIEPLFAWLIEEGAVAWQVQLTAAMGRAADEDNILLQPYQVLETHPMLVRAKRFGSQRGVRMWPGNNIGYFGPYEHVLRGDWAGGHRGTCGAGRSTLGIEANGDIKGCPSLPTSDYVGGNIRDHALKEIWLRAPELRLSRDMTKDKLSGFCATCYYADDCRGGCHWTSHVLLGYPGDNPYCHHRAVELLDRNERERVRVKTPAPGEPFDYATYVIDREPWPTEALRRRAQEITETGEGFLEEA